MKSLRKAGFLLSITALLIAGQPGVEASHFRGGNIEVSVNSAGIMTVRTETLWRKPTQNDLIGVCTGGGDPVACFVDADCPDGQTCGNFAPINPAFPLAGITRLAFFGNPIFFTTDLQILDATSRAVLFSTLHCA